MSKSSAPSADGGSKRTEAVPRWLWLWFPPLLLVIVFAVKIGWPQYYDRWVESEQGLMELATPVVAIWGFAVGIQVLRRVRHIPFVLMRVWVLLVILGCFYFVGEELSWGQQLLHWRTPAVIDKLNDQHETNLHNMSSWFDQKPRMLLEIWVMVGGIYVPARNLDRRTSTVLTNSFWSWFWPTVVCLPTSVLAIGIKLPQRYKHLMHPLQALPIEIRWSEPQEYYFALFMLLYLLVVHARIQTSTPL